MTGPSLADIEAAADRIKDRVRRTPFLRARFLLDPPAPGEILLKLECLQVTGSFKPRGASNALASLTPEEIGRGVITASCRCDPPATSAAQEVQLQTSLHDQAGTLVATATASWRIGPRLTR